MKILIKTADAIDALIDRIGWFAAAVTLAMVLLISGNTLGRYFFNVSTIWLQELEWHLLALIAFLGLSYMQLRGVPVRVDMFHQNFSERTKLWMDFGTALLVMLPFSLFICVLGWRFAMHSFAVGEVSPDPGGLPMRWIVKSLVIVGYALLALVAIGTVIRCGAQLARPQLARHEPGGSHGQ
ncbi:MAG: TRAP transporter small permease subunit [Betaproteobacteria bacterium]|jgi:TRAP-type mannitol/chloroaromatic compound transport system permease small subunit|nr:TRAP transporter small permease subunit [Betaproteobacteria bacterium]